VESETIGGWLAALASAEPAPGGGAAAALEAAIGAALVEMVCNLTAGRPAYAEHEEAVAAVRDRAARVRGEATGLAAEDAAAFAAVIGAYRLPHATEAESADRADRIQAALAHAADVSRRTARAAAEVLDLAERLAPIGNVNVIADAAAAAAAARASLQTALLNIDANLAAITDPGLAAELDGSAAGIARELDRADTVVARVRERTAG
jgi:formiminotetrahydrofolate cyclodeaminase